MLLRRNILLLHAGALGDFVCTWPLAMAMGRMFAQSRIIYVTAREKGRLAEKAIRVDSSEIEAGWHALFAESPKVPEPVGKLLSGAQTIFNFLSEPGDVFSQNLDQLAPAAKRFTMSTRTHPRPGHVVQWLADDLADFPPGAEGVRQMIRSVTDRGLGAYRPADDAVLIHPGSGSPTKNWPAEKYLDVVRELTAAGRTVRVLLGEVEAERWPRETIATFERAADVVRPATYVELYDHLTRAAAFLGNDSGPGHLAAMIGVPTVSLFGPTDPDVWRPVGPSVTVVRREAIDQIPVDEVLAAVQSISVPRRQVTTVVDDD